VIDTPSFIQGNGGFAEQDMTPIQCDLTYSGLTSRRDAAVSSYVSNGILALADAGNYCHDETLLVHGGSRWKSDRPYTGGPGTWGEVIATGRAQKESRACFGGGGFLAIDIGAEISRTRQ